LPILTCLPNVVDSCESHTPMATDLSSGRVHFGVFEADLRSGELRKQGIKIKLHDQPFQVLTMLLERPGEVITREQLHQRLWPADTFVDFDVGLNSAVKKLRDALGDSANTPRYVETLPRRGYRFIAPIEGTRVGIVAAQQEHRDRIPSQHGDDGSGQVGAVLNLSLRPAGLKPRTRSWRKAGITATVLAVLATASWWLVRPKSSPYTIAVLPFKNLSSEPDSDYFSDGLTDEIIRNLSLIDGLQVKSRTSSFAFKDKSRNIHEVGAQLGASLVLEGSILRSSDKLRINAQLIRVSDDVPLWSNRFDRALKDVFAIQDEISRSIVNELRLKLGSGQRRYNTDLEAYELYLRAEPLANLPPSDDTKLLKSIQLFEEVIAKDPDFAPAYAGIAEAYANLSASPRSFSPDEAYTKMRVASEKALRLDPLLAEAHASMGLVYSRDRDWEAAERAFRRAIQLNPNLSRPHVDFATWVLFPLGRLEEALRELRTALELDPLSLNVQNSLNYLLISAGRYVEVLENCRRVLAVDPDDPFAQQLSGRALLQKGRLNEAIAMFEKQDSGPGFLGYAYAKAGRRAEAEQVAAQYPDWPWVQALVYGGLGDKDRAFEGLEKMAAINDPRVAIYLSYPELALLRGDPRLRELRRKLGLPAP
jgi:TolB-like protein/DNA-binding winged helix-turn-helix (wHTH) protein